MREARSGAERMRAVVRDLKTFARDGDERLRPVDVRQVLESCVNVAWSEIRRRARSSCATSSRSRRCSATRRGSRSSS